MILSAAADVEGCARNPFALGRHSAEGISLDEAEGGVSDETLVRSFLARREEDAFRGLFRRHTPALFRLALRLLGGDRAGAEDAVQEAWMRAVARLPEFRFESALRTWLSGFVVNCCRESSRRPGARLPEAPLAATGLAAAPHGEPERALDLERAVLSLADGYRAVFVLHDLMGFTHREIARRLEIEEGTSKSQLFLARRALRSRLGERAVSKGSPWMTKTS
jgi:RNA polymerase sigma-70 factor (ECF subfamily)